MYYGAGLDPYHFEYYRNEYYQPIPPQMNHPYPMQQQDMNFLYPLQQEMSPSFPAFQQGMSQPNQQMSPNQMNYPSYPQAKSQQMPEQAKENENETPSQTAFDYFQKPEQPMNWPNNASFDPTQFQQGQQPPAGIISQFQNQNGQIDVDKVIGTVGQLAHTYHQVAPIFKQFGSLMKTFRG